LVVFITIAGKLQNLNERKSQLIGQLGDSLFKHGNFFFRFHIVDISLVLPYQTSPQIGHEHPFHSLLVRERWHFGQRNGVQARAIAPMIIKYGKPPITPHNQGLRFLRFANRPRTVPNPAHKITVMMMSILIYSFLFIFPNVKRMHHWKRVGKSLSGIGFKLD
jgi:hypothetical protein